MTINICYHTDEQLPIIAAMVAEKRIDTLFIQEANGCIERLLQAIRKHDRYREAICDYATHIIVRKGRALPLYDLKRSINFDPIRDPSSGIPVVRVNRNSFDHIELTWPHRFYSLMELPQIGECILVNIHMCEEGYESPRVNALSAVDVDRALSASEQETLSEVDRDEYRYRVQYLERMLQHLEERSALQTSEIPIIFAGDFNSSSHRDPAGSRKRISSSLTLERAGFTDCWLAAQPDPLGLEPTWPVPLQSMSGNRFLESQVGDEAVPARIDFIYVGRKAIASRLQVESCENYYTESDWFSDHTAVIATFRVLFRSDRSIRYNIGRSIKCRPPVWIDLYQREGLWYLSAQGLSGGRGWYIEVEILELPKDVGKGGSRNNLSTNWRGIGYLYIDGLTEVTNLCLTTTPLYHYSTFDSYFQLDPELQVRGRLCDDGLETRFCSKPYRL